MAATLKLVRQQPPMTNRPKRGPKREQGTLRQKRHRQIAWVLYATDGYAAHLSKLIEARSDYLSRDDLALLHRMLADAERLARSVRLRVSIRPNDIWQHGE